MEYSIGQLNLKISEDRMEVYAFYPSQGEKLDLAFLEGQLNGLNICHGLDSKRLQQVVEYTHMGNSVENILIARGTMPQKGTPKYIHLKPRLFHPPELPDSSVGLVDFRMVSPFIMVKEGEVLGRIVEETQGKEGIDVFGQPVIPGKKDITLLEAGENTETTDDVVKSLISGRFVFDGKHFSISDTLIVDGDVDYSTGHISFAGDVIIKGEIKDGFRVAAGGGVHCKKTLDASELLCRKDLIIEGGIKGKNTGLVRVQGKIETRFIENCHVESQKGVSVKSSLLDSELYSLGEVLLDRKKGTVLGGVTYCEKGLTTFNLGSPRNSHTLIYAGISYLKMRKLKHLEKRLVVLNGKIESLNNMPPSTNILQLLEKAKKAKEILQVSIGNFLVDQYTDFNGEVAVYGSVFPGTEITICDRHIKITEVLTNVCFYYDHSGRTVSHREIK